jgi:hypothetical protein
MKNRQSIFLLAGGLLLSTGCSSVFDKQIEYTYEEPDYYPVLRAVGYAPLSSQPGESDTQKMLMAVKVSKLEAYRELAEQVHGQKLSSTMTVKGAIAQTDGLSSKVGGLIKGAKIVKMYSVGDTYATELELDMKKVHELYISTIKPRKVKRVIYY